MSLRSLYAGILIGGTLLSLPAFATDPVNDTLTNQQPQASSSAPLSIASSAGTPALAQAAPASDVKLPGLGTIQTTDPVTPVTAPEPERDLLAEAAVAYGSFQLDASRFDRDLNSTTDIEEATTTLGTHNIDRLSSGWLAYSALLASQSPEYAKSIRKTDAHYGRERMLAGFANSVTYALDLEGSRDALTRAIDASKADARRLERIGDNVREQSKSLQKFGWATAKLKSDSNKDARTLELAALDGRPQSGGLRTLFGSPRVEEAVVSADRLGSTSSLWDRLIAAGPDIQLPVISTTGVSTYQPVETFNKDRRITAGRIATLAAYRILDEADTTSAGLSRAMDDAQTKDCFETAQQIFRQCVSANYKVFERPYCIGEHALKDVGRCVGEISE